jgi:citrate lyase beta subunit
MSKAIGAGVDAVILDLDDSVTVAAKPEVWPLVAAAICAQVAAAAEPAVYVRSNGAATGQLADDLETIVRTGDLVKCRGMLLNTDIVVDELTALDDIGALQIVFTREPRSDAMDQPVIRVERSKTERLMKRQFAKS